MLIFLSEVLKSKIKKLGIAVLYGDLEGTNGLYLDDLKLIVLKNGLSEDEEDFAILHELVHIEEHTDFVVYYNATATSRRKFEHEAVQKSVKHELESKVNEDSVINIELVSKNYGLKMGDEDWLEKILRQSLN